MILYAATIFLGAFLLFQVQPIIARLLLPWFGGSAVVWTTCMLFFQSALLLGYFHGWATRRFLRPRTRALLHVLLLGLSTALLPILPPPSWRPSGASAPVLPLLELLVVTVGLPYVLLASTTPLLQDWFAERYPGRDPYRLFSLSNLASLLALLGYPLLVEPNLGGTAQARVWSGAYMAFVLLCGGMALSAYRRAARLGDPAPLPVAPPHGDGDGDDDGDDPDAPPTRGTMARWVILPACATAFLLALTSYLTLEVAAIPLLWVLPLSVYLFTFVLAFARLRIYRRVLFRLLVTLALPGLAFLRFYLEKRPPLSWMVGLWCGGLFIVCMVMHGEVAESKPAPSRLTLYYLLISVGGALGGLLVGVAAPLLLPANYDLEITVFVCAICALWAFFSDEAAWAMVQERPLAAIAAVAWVLSLGALLAIGAGREYEAPVKVARNFYGTLRIFDLDLEAGDGNGVRKLLNGSINHGGQFRSPERALTATTYYCDTSGAGLAAALHHPERPRAIGVIGLGAGSMAAWGRPGDHVRFYEINPLCEQIARSYFTYLSRSPAQVDVVLGDARLSLEREADNQYDVLVVDAFSGDAIPVHLITREAFALYGRHLREDGILAVHISNRHLDLEPVVADGAASLHRTARQLETADDEDRYCFKTDWVLITADTAFFDRAELSSAQPLLPTPGFRPWTDDYSNILSVLR